MSPTIDYNFNAIYIFISPNFDSEFIFTGLTLKTDIQTFFDLAAASNKPLITCQDEDFPNLSVNNRFLNNRNRE